MRIDLTKHKSASR